MKLGIVLLCAGEGARMGEVPKALITVDGQPLLQRHLQVFEALGAAWVGVVTGHHAQRIEPLLQGRAVQVLRVPDPAQGQQASVRWGLEAAPAGLDALAIVLCDQPGIGLAEWRELLQAYEPNRVVVPHVAGQRGHPVLLPVAVLQAVLAGGEGMVPRRYMAQHPECVKVLESANRNFVLDLDTPQDVRAYGTLSGQRVQTPPA